MFRQDQVEVNQTQKNFKENKNILPKSEEPNEEYFLNLFKTSTDLQGLKTIPKKVEKTVPFSFSFFDILENLNPEYYNDKEIFLECIRLNKPEQYNLASKELKNDFDFNQQALVVCEYLFHRIPKYFQNDEKFILSMVEKLPSNAYVYPFLNDDLKKNFGLTKKFLIARSSNYEHIPTQFKEKDDIIPLAEGYYLSKLPFYDRSFIQSCYWTKLPNYFLKNFDFLKKAIQSRKFEHSVFQYLPKEYKEDEKYLIHFLKYEKVTRNGYSAFRFAPEKLRKKKEIIMLSLHNIYNIVECANLKLLNDKDVALKAMSNQPSMSHYIPKSLFDKEFATKVLKLKNVVFKQYPRKDFSFYVGPMEFIAEDFLKNFNFSEEELINIIKENGNVLHFLDLGDYSKEFLFEALIYCKDALKIDFDFDRDLIMQSMKYHGENLKYAPNELRDDEEVVFSAFSVNPRMSFKFMSLRLRNEKQFLLNIIHGRRYQIKNCGELKNDVELFWKSHYHNLIRDIDLKNVMFSFSSQ
eukprot:gene12174-5664_t